MWLNLNIDECTIPNVLNRYMVGYLEQVILQESQDCNFRDFTVYCVYVYIGR